MARFKRVLILGVGNIGGSLARALLKAREGEGARYAGEVLLLDPKPEALRPFAKEGAIVGSSSEEIALLDSPPDLVVLAVKPAVASEALKSLFAPGILFEQSGTAVKPILCSVAAGLSLAVLESFCADKFLGIVRVMPNLAMSIEQGMTAIFAPEKLLATEVAELFSLVGETLVCDREEQLNLATALCGSGPAFFFKVIQELASTATELGFSREAAEKMTIQTALGAVELLRTAQADPAEWIRRVATPGGTTEAGLAEMEKRGLSLALSEGLKASYTRASSNLA